MTLPLLGGIIAASLLGSIHCAGMCGPLVAVAAAPVQVTSSGRTLYARGWWRGGGASAFTLSSFFNLGRLATYLLLGAAAGSLGRVFDFGGKALGVQRGAAVAAGAMLLAMGIVLLLQHFGVPLKRFPIPAFITRTLASLHATVNRFGPLARAFAIGSLSGLLPCGWLYAFVLTAGGTASAPLGALVMLAFWIGTVPILTFIGAGLHAALAPIRRHMPVLTAVLLISVGVGSLIWRTTPAFATTATADSGTAPCPLCDLKEQP